MSINSNSFIDIDYYNSMVGESDLIIVSSSGQSYDEIRLTNLINMVATFMELFCDRLLKARDFSYISTEDSYDPKYSIFDPPPKSIFWFPTYPVNTITTFIISDTTILPASSYDDDTGYFLYNSTGKLVYYYGFDYGYNQNIKVKWNGGYTTDHKEYEELQYLQYLLVNNFWNNDPNDDGLLSETLGNYKYTKADPKTLAKFFGVPPFIFYSLSNYRRTAIS